MSLKKSRFTLTIIALLVYLIPGSILAQPIEVDRIEPENWWVGFQNPEVQLLVYGNDIQSARASVDYPGVTIERTTLVENPNYQFVTLRIEEDTEPGTLQLDFQRGEHSHTIKYEIRERNNGTDRNQGFDSTDLIYLLMPDRFANGDPSNDEIEGMLEGVNRDNPNARHGGDIQGVIDNLDYLEELGMTAVWFTPIIENDMPPEYGAYHGYAATDMYRVDRRYGSNEKYLELIDKAHDRGMKVIMDMIHNHVGTEHWFVKDQPTDDWLHDLDEVGTTNFRTSTVMDPYASEHDYNSTVQGWFVVDMPDLDQRNELVANYLIQNTLWWIEYSGIDGIRMDTHPYPYKEYMADWSRRVLEEFPDFNMVGEAWMPNTPSTAYWQTGFPSPDGYESYLPSVTDFPLYGSLTAGLNEEPGWDTGISRLYFTLSQDFLFPDANLNVIFPGNHDLDRIFTVMGESYGKFRIAQTFIMTTRGIPQLYYGDEILMTGGGPDGLKRKDFPGGWEEDLINAFTPEGREQLAEETGFPVVEAHEFMTTLANWRKDNDVVHNGQLTHFIPENNVYVYFRHNDEKRVMVVLNGNEESDVLYLSRFSELIRDSESGYDVISRDTIELGETLNLDGYETMVIELE
ncbi:MAG: glycoside hydrolase family 13 protein [Balneolaceae bacterium]